jgi:hypothetical protein
MVPARLVVRVARHHEVHSRARALAPPCHFAAALRHERDKSRARKGTIHQRTAAANGQRDSSWWWCSQYTSASAHGGCKHRPARAAASAPGGSKRRPAHAYASEHVLHGEHVRGAGLRQHVRQAARGREVEGVTNGTPVTGSTAPDRTRHAASESPAVSVSGRHTRSHTSSVVASTSSAPRERWGWADSRRSPPRGRRGRSQVARKGSCPCARRAACSVTATRARGRLVFSRHHRQDRATGYSAENACNTEVSHESGPAVDAHLNPNLHALLRLKFLHAK